MYGLWILVYYNQAAEQVDYLPTSKQRSIRTRGMNITRKTSRASSFAEGSPCVKTIFGASTYENNQWVLG
eukprot:5036315-Pyramimonas_sp.AAC.2